MFRNRNNHQKPDDDFISRFQQTFSEIVPRREGETEYDDNSSMGPGRFTGNHDPNLKMEDVGIKFNNQRTPRNLQDLNFSPSWMDPTAMQMMSNFAGQHPGFYTPNSGGMGAVFHNQAGDLHTPTAGLNMITPLSLANPMSGSQPNGHPVHLDHQFNPHFLPSHMPDINPYMQQASYAPSAFLHRDSFDAMDESSDNRSLQSIPVDQESNLTASTDHSNAVNMSYAEGENFRYNVTLRAPTAMVKHKREIPISYLNKGQTYNMAVIDSSPPVTSPEPVKYRTFVRISFDEEEQRAKPAVCWQLWKEGRGTNESHQRGGKLLAVEYVEPLKGGDSNKHRQIEIEQMSFDGFCVTWTANPGTGASDCVIPVRFNFLSTDFSHSKGVKGIPVRLCTKTEILSPGEDSGVTREMEVSYCKVKLFRDHGAERKLSNDIAHVKKTIEKLKQQIAQAELGGGYGKRKRGSAMNTKDRSMKGSKHKRTWSNGSQDAASDKMSLEDDLQAKLVVMQDMFSSTRNVSVLALRGELQDDPDLFPVRLPMEGEKTAVDGLDRQNKSASHSMESLILSPSSSNASLNSPRLGNMKRAGIQRVPTNDSSVGYLEAIDIDPTYRPPSERPPKPIACFYVKFSGNEQQPPYYRAIYLTERTVRDLMKKISEKRHIDPSRIVRILHVNQNGLRIMVDDDVVRELPEGQDMIADIYEAQGPGGGFPDSPMEIKLTY
ncbi:hypothetical protein PENSTE_c003G04050 [Penicillium steckii]|uniref:Grh/CP2 DB domain-containing protein n=1 Tax=Penicillium steckii TaxID=303698 RepID=A0A1V6TS24_9EURO|nr:hypothetical protein PENSTE_c003G04050 [Penicillium steckii]